MSSQNQKKRGFTLPQKREDENTIISKTPIYLNLPKVSGFTSNKAIRRILKTRSKCNCCCCLDSGIRYDYDYEVLQEEIKSTQKSIAHCKEDTNKILDKVERLEAYFQ